MLHNAVRSTTFTFLSSLTLFIAALSTSPSCGLAATPFHPVPVSLA